MKKYSDTEKRSIIDRYIINGESPSSIFSDTGIPKSTFYNWIKLELSIFVQSLNPQN